MSSSRGPAKAVRGGGGGGAIGLLLVWLLGRLGVSLTAEDGSVIALALAGAGAFVWHHGLAGLYRQLLDGDGRP